MQRVAILLTGFACAVSSTFLVHSRRHCWASDARAQSWNRTHESCVSSPSPPPPSAIFLFSLPLESSLRLHNSYVSPNGDLISTSYPGPRCPFRGTSTSMMDFNVPSCGYPAFCALDSFLLAGGAARSSGNFGADDEFVVLRWGMICEA